MAGTDTGDGTVNSEGDDVHTRLRVKRRFSPPPSMTGAAGTATDAVKTLLRVKRSRSEDALDSLHVALPPGKRARVTAAVAAMSLGGVRRTVRFRRVGGVVKAGRARPFSAHAATALMEEAELLVEEGGVRIIDVDPRVVRRVRKGDAPPVLCNGVEMARVVADVRGKDHFVYDLFAMESGEGARRGLPVARTVLAADEADAARQLKASVGGVVEGEADEQEDGGNVAYVYASELPSFDVSGIIDSGSESDDDEDDGGESDLDALSVDYPSTPGSSSDGGSDTENDSDDGEHMRMPFGFPVDNNGDAGSYDFDEDNSER